MIGVEIIFLLGFYKKFEIKFVEDFVLLLVVYICDFLLEIFRGEIFEEFYRKMELVIICGGEFYFV